MANLHEAGNDLRIAAWSMKDALDNARGTPYEDEIQTLLEQVKTLRDIIEEASDEARGKALATP